MSDKEFVCRLCEASFIHNRSLRRHVSKFHPTSDLEEIAPSRLPLPSFQCEFCSQSFYKENRLQYHVKSKHYSSNACELNFESFETFLMWKKQEEQSELVYFTKNKTYYNQKHSTVTHFYNCHRSGRFVTRSRGERQLKSQGSCKIGQICPAKMKAIVQPDGFCKVKYNSRHVGHKKEIQHLRKSLVFEKFIVDENIENQVLENTKFASGSNSSLEEIYLSNKQDLEAEEKVTSKMQAIFSNHQKSTSIPSNNILPMDDGSWILKSNSISYRVKKVDLEECDCKLVCHLCQTCIHKYTCDCSDAVIQENMCQHIHAVCLYLNNTTSNEEYICNDARNEEFINKDARNEGYIIKVANNEELNYNNSTNNEEYITNDDPSNEDFLNKDANNIEFIIKNASIKEEYIIKDNKDESNKEPIDNLKPEQYTPTVSHDVSSLELPDQKEVLIKLKPIPKGNTLTSVPHNIASTDLPHQKEVLLKKFTNILGCVNSIEEFKTVEQSLTTMEANLHSIKIIKSPKNTMLSEQKIRPSPIIPKTRLYLIKKKSLVKQISKLTEQ